MELAILQSFVCGVAAGLILAVVLLLLGGFIKVRVEHANDQGDTE